MAHNPHKKKIAVVFDLDNSLIKWQHWSQTKDEKGFAETLNTLNHHQAELCILFNTGRSLASIKKIAPHLAPVCMASMILNNGQEIYNKPDSETFSQWASTLNRDNQDAHWQSQLQQQTNWQLETVWKTFRAVLQEYNFIPLTPKLATELTSRKGLPPNLTVFQQGEAITEETLLIFSEGDQPSLIFRTLGGVFKKQNQEIVTAIEARISKQLKDNAIQFSTRQYSFEKAPEKTTPIHCVDLWFEPEGASKGSALNYWLLNQNNLKAVITVGDHHYNDWEMMSQQNYTDSRTAQLPNFPILVGQDPILHQQVQSSISDSLIAYAESGYLADALTQQINRINQLTPKSGESLSIH